jgi:polyphosphate kinase
LENSDLFFDRELSLLAFNRRVLALAQDNNIPLLERLKFLSICSSNLDEFFEVRVASIKQQVHSNITDTDESSLPPKIALKRISEVAHKLIQDQYQCLNEQLIPLLAKEDIHIIDNTLLDSKRGEILNETDSDNQESINLEHWLESYFDNQVLPILSPIKLQAGSPFPLTINKGLCLILHLHDDKGDKKVPNLAITPVPRALPRFLRLPKTDNTKKEYQFINLSTLIERYAHKLLPNSKIKGCYQLRITRNSDLFVDPEAVEDLLQALEGELPSRRFGDAVRLEVSQDCPQKITDYLLERFQLESSFLYQNDGPVNLNRLIHLPGLINRSDLKFPYFQPSIPDKLRQSKSIFEVLRKQDVLLHHPYESFLPVLDFLAQAAKDPDVLVIKQTLYRTGKDSIILDHLMEAARNGKEVIVVIELMARFDEETNISTATKLQQAGVHVVFGQVGRKTHAKLLMVVRKENDKIQRYCHIGTGNYHQSNTAIYTDYGYMTSNKSVTEDVHQLFMQLTTYGDNPKLKNLVQSPNGIRDMLLDNIQIAIENVQSGKSSRLVAKMNGLVSPIIVKALYEASQAGVQIDLIVRGTCCLKPQVAGLSDNIRVHSILGRFLEHGRVYWFQNDEKDTVYCSSADWMPRNLLQRIEAAVQIKDNQLKQRLIDDLQLYINDNQQRWELDAEGVYHRIKPNDDEATIDAQKTLLENLSQSH